MKKRYHTYIYVILIIIFILSIGGITIGCNFNQNKQQAPETNNKSIVNKSNNPKLVKAPFYAHIEGLADIEAPENFDWKQFNGVTLNFICESNIYANVLSKEAEQFSKITGVSVNIHPMDYNTMIEKINLDFVSKAGKYQIIYADPYKTLNRFSDNFVDLKTLNKDPNLPHIPGGIEDFLEMQVDVDSYFLNRDKLYTIPFDSTTMILFYRKDIFEKYKEKFKAGKGYDWTPGTKDFTWERYCEIAAWINNNVPKNEVKYGCGQQAAQANSLFCDFSNVLAAYGGNYFNQKDVESIGVKNPGKSSFGDSKSINALKIYKKILKVAHPLSLSWEWGKMAEAFNDGEIAMMANFDEYSSSIENLEKSKVAGKVGYSILPYGSVRSANIFGGTGIGINNIASEIEKKAAWLFIIYATSPQTELMVLMHPEGGDIPSRKSIYSLPEVKDAVDRKTEIFKNHPTMATLPDVLNAWKSENSYLRPKLESSADVELIVINSIHNMLINDGDPAETAKSIAKQIDAFTEGR